MGDGPLIGMNDSLKVEFSQAGFVTATVKTTDFSNYIL